MQFNRPRFTVRSLMFAVAVLAVLLGLILAYPDWADRRRARFERTGYKHAWTYEAFGRSPSLGDVRRLAYHDLMRKKYHNAVRYPWMPVMPDPPEPQ
jgi:hypothetical protein